MIMQWTKQSSTSHTARWSGISFTLEQDPKTYRWHCRADGKLLAVKGKVQTWPSAGIAMNHMDAVQTDALKKRVKRTALFERPRPEARRSGLPPLTEERALIRGPYLNYLIQGRSEPETKGYYDAQRA